MRLAAILCLAALIVPLPALSTTIHVPADQPTIQAGINAAAFAGDTVLVAPGTYTGAGNKNLNLMGKAILLMSELGAESTIIDCEGQGQGFRFQTGEDHSSVLRGFTIRNGVATGVYPDNWGGGILCIGSSPSIEDCVIESGAADRGGGLGCFDSSPLLVNCIIRNNTANAGCGIYCQTNCKLNLSNCTITDNHGELSRGGGMALEVGCSAVLDNSLISENLGGDGGGLYIDDSSINGTGETTIRDNEGDRGGGIFVGNGSTGSLFGLGVIGNLASEGGFQRGGGGIYLDSFSEPLISSCQFSGNYASGGGAAFLSYATPSFVDCSFASNISTDVGGAIKCINAWPTFSRCLFAGNTASNVGGAVYTQGLGGLVRIVSSTLYQNSATNGGAVYIQLQERIELDRSIIAFSPSGGAIMCGDDVVPVLSCCDVYGNLGGDWTGCIADQQGVNGNFTALPRFCDAPNGDFTLNALSPCAPANSPPGCGLIGALPVACGVTDVADSPPIADVQLTVIPNPVRGTARFELGSAAPSTTLSIFDSQGRLVEQLLRQDGHWEWTPGPSVSAGVYFAQPGAEIGGPVKFLYLR